MYQMFYCYDCRLHKALFFKDLCDALNFGLYLPPVNGRAGKFLAEERYLREYPLQGPIGFLEVLK